VRKWEEYQNSCDAKRGSADLVRSSRQLDGEVGHHHALDHGEPWNRIRTQILA